MCFFVWELPRKDFHLLSDPCPIIVLPCINSLSQCPFSKFLHVCKRSWLLSLIWSKKVISGTISESRNYRNYSRNYIIAESHTYNTYVHILVLKLSWPLVEIWNLVKNFQGEISTNWAVAPNAFWKSLCEMPWGREGEKKVTSTWDSMDCLTETS